ncbi:MAG: DNA repair exonuclease [Acidimicrobiales bacterium]|nr:DNA repair exonuclease [Acidimicrobiales bacterium]
MLRFLHAADLHLDTPVSAVGGYPPAVAELLRDASLQAWDRLVETASARRVAFVLLAGDVYDGAERGLRAQRRFLAGLTRLSEEGIRSFVVHGNHDPVEEGWSAVARFPDLVRRFEPHEVGSEAFTVDGQPVVVHGISYAVRHTTENLAARFPPATDGAFHVGLLHANVGGPASGHADYAPCTLADLRRVGYDYWALGHVHRAQVLHRGDPWVVYPGNLQGRSPKPSERGPKGAVVVEVDGGRPRTPEPVALDVVRFEELAVSIGDHDVLSLLDELTTRAAPEAHDGRAVVVRARVEGAGPLHAELLSADRRRDVLAELRQRGAEATSPVWWDRLEWRTRPARDLDDLRRRNDFVADLLTTTEGGDEVWTGWIDALPHEVRRLLGDDCPDPADPDIREQAIRLALDHVLGADS